MTWGELKAQAEALGMTDDRPVWVGGSLSVTSPVLSIDEGLGLVIAPRCQVTDELGLLTVGSIGVWRGLPHE